MEKVPAYILAGGRSSRFGSDKARAEVAGVPLVRRVAEGLGGVASRVTVVAEVAGKYADLGLRTVADLQVDLGPMGGLRTALADLEEGEGWLLLVSCDLVAPPETLVRGLLRETEGAGQRMAIAYRGERWEPLLALYHRSIAGEVAARLARGERGMQRLLEAVKARGVPKPAAWPSVAQVNTREELARFLREGGGG